MIRVYIGTEPKTEIACQVLEFSIKRRTGAEVQFIRMIGPAWEYSLEGIKVGTGFSLRRWMIPAAADWHGKAIYLDADQLVLDDIQELWNKDQDSSHSGDKDPVIWCSYQPDKFSAEPWPQTSVMLIDCEVAVTGWGFHIDLILEHLRAHPEKSSYAEFMHADWLEGSVCRIGDEWNHLNKFVPKGQPRHTRLLHFTSESSQPWVKPDHPLAHLWTEELKEAIRAGAVSKTDFKEALGKWKVKEDWRPTNGLHPYYKKYLSLF